MDIQRVQSLLNKEEGPKLDFKQRLNIDTESSKKELAKDICAIANSRGGRGYIIFGIEDKSKDLVGIDPKEFQEEKIQQIVSMRIDPPIPVSVETIKYKNYILGIITIFNTEQKPHQVRENGAFYIRRGSTTDIMRKEEIAAMLQDMGLINYELMPIKKASIGDLDKEKIKDYFLKAGLPLNIDNQMLLSAGILSKEKDYNEYNPTCGGMLLFGKSPYIYLPHSIIKIYNSLSKTLPCHFIAKGTVMDMLDEAYRFIDECLQGIDYPRDVIKEFLGKSLVHRDYCDVNNSVNVYIKKNYIEIINPGSAIKESNNSDKYVRRNMWLYLNLSIIDKEKKFFNKDLNLKLLTKEYGRIKYYNIMSKNLFKVLIPIVK